MTSIENIIRQINRDLLPQFEERLRGFLAAQDRDWLIEQIVRLALDAHSLHEMDRKHLLEIKARQRQERAARLCGMALDHQVLSGFMARYRGRDRDGLIADGFLLPGAPPKGTDLIRDEHRTAPGNMLLEEAKDVLFGLLFGDGSLNVSFDRSQRELLTFTLPRFKAAVLNFMQAATELSAAGTWQDPESVSNDSRADNVVLEVEFGETSDELIGNGIVCCLGLINNLEVNEQILYGRMINVEQSTLID